MIVEPARRSRTRLSIARREGGGAVFGRRLSYYEIPPSPRLPPVPHRGSTPDHSLVTSRRAVRVRSLALYVSGSAERTAESREASAPRVRSIYCNPLRKHPWSNGGGTAKRTSILTVKPCVLGMQRKGRSSASWSFRYGQIANFWVPPATPG